MHDEVADDQVVAAIRELELVRGVAGQAVVEAVVQDVVVQRASLHQVPAPALAEAAAGEREAADRADVEQVMQQAFVVRRFAELAVLHREFQARVVGCEQAHLVVEESTAPHLEAAALEADARAVAGGNPGAAEFEVLDDERLPVRDQDCLALRAAAIGVEPGACAQAAYRQEWLVDHRHVTEVVAYLQLDGVAAVGGAHGVVQCAPVVAVADRQRATRAALRSRQHGCGQGQDQLSPCQADDREAVSHLERCGERLQWLITPDPVPPAARLAAMVSSCRQSSRGPERRESTVRQVA